MEERSRGRARRRRLWLWAGGAAAAVWVGWAALHLKALTVPVAADPAAYELPPFISLPLRSYTPEELRMVPGTLERHARGGSARYETAQEEAIVVSREDLERTVLAGTPVPVPPESPYTDLLVRADRTGRIQRKTSGPTLAGWTIRRVTGPAQRGLDIRETTCTPQDTDPPGHYLRLWIHRDTVMLECPRGGTCALVAILGSDGTIDIRHGRVER